MIASRLRNQGTTLLCLGDTKEAGSRCFPKEACPSAGCRLGPLFTASNQSSNAVDM